MEANEYIILIAGMVFVTYLPRFLPLILLSQKNLPSGIVRWLGYIPVAVLSALLAPGILLKDGELFLSTKNISLLAFFPTIFIAVKTKNIFLTVLGGFFSYLFIQILI